MISQEPLLSKPGEQYNYGASGFVVLGLIIERVTGESYYDFVREHILTPAGMFNTTELEIDAVVSNKASGYTTFFDQGNTLKKNDLTLSKASPGGFYYSTTYDLFQFSKSLRNGILIDPQLVKTMLEPKVKGYYTHLGYGVSVDQRYNQTIVGHSGGWYGVRGELMDFSTDGFTVVILSNIDDDGTHGTTKVSNFFKALIADKTIE